MHDDRLPGRQAFRTEMITDLPGTSLADLPSIHDTLR